MKDHVFSDQVRQGLGDLSKISPTLEATKFFGKNLGRTTLGITAPIAMSYALDKIQNWMNNKDE